MTKLSASLIFTGLLLLAACTSSPTPTATGVPTATATVTPTATPRPTATSLPTPAPTTRPTQTAPPTPTTKPTATTIPAATLVPTQTATPTVTPVPTGTPTPIATPFGQFPLLPNHLSGTVTVGEEPAPNGLFIEARVLWYRSEPAKVYEGSYVALILSPNDWALQGETITFHIGDLQAEETATYNGRSFQVVTLDLIFPKPSPPLP